MVNDEMILYKYISFERFIELIEMEKLYLTKISLWEDIYEGMEYEWQIEKSIPKHIQNTPEFSPFIQAIVKSERDTSYGQSWSKNKESDAMWRIYSQNKVGVKIGIKLKNIKKQIEKKLREISKDINLESYEVEYGIEHSDFTKLKYKRQAFSHEEEYRFSFILPIKIFESQLNDDNGNFLEKIESLNYGPVVHYEVPNKMIEEIVLDPRAANHDEEMFLAYCNNKKLGEKGIRFYKSKLYTRT